MKTFDVQVRHELWKYYRIHVEAASAKEAEAQALELWNAGEYDAFSYETGEDDGNGATVTDCNEVQP
jgi:hypothetical protein